MTTSKKFFGFVSGAAQESDQIWVSSFTPRRPHCPSAANGDYYLVGKAYVRGGMTGEVFT